MSREWTPRGWETGWPTKPPKREYSIYEYLRADGTIMVEIFQDGSVRFDSRNRFGAHARAFWEALAAIATLRDDDVIRAYALAAHLQRKNERLAVQLTHQQFRIGGYIPARSIT